MTSIPDRLLLRRRLEATVAAAHHLHQRREPFCPLCRRSSP